MTIKINKLEIENVKRIKAVKVEPSASGLTIVGGNNNQGKTSVLDSIAWALGGNKYKPSKATREGSVIPPTLKVTMSNGLIVERKGKNSELKVIDPEGNKGGQKLLDSFVEELAINLPKFMESTPKEKADTLLQIIGVGDKLVELEKKEKEVYDKRHAIGVIADQKEKFAKEQTYYPEAPKELVSISELIEQQQDILAKNGANARLRQNVEQIRYAYDQAIQEQERLRQQLAEADAKTVKLAEELKIAQTDAIDLKDESTAEIEENIAGIDEINRKVRTNLDREKAEEDAKQQREEYNGLTAEIEKVRQEKRDLLTNANLPLEGLTVDDGKLIYLGQEWDNMSGSQQLQVATAIVRKLKPNCGFVLIDKLEQMDNVTLEQFGVWLEQEGLQAIATRVSTGDECSIIISDGYAVDGKPVDNKEPFTMTQSWNGGF